MAKTLELANLLLVDASSDLQMIGILSYHRMPHAGPFEGEYLPDVATKFICPGVSLLVRPLKDFEWSHQNL